jgi:hypothetical protein
MCWSLSLEELRPACAQSVAARRSKSWRGFGFDSLPPKITAAQAAKATPV